MAYEIETIEQGDPLRKRKEDGLISRGFEKYAENRRFVRFRRKNRFLDYATEAAIEEAERRGIDIMTLHPGSGTGGKVVLADVEAALEEKADNVN